MRTKIYPSLLTRYAGNRWPYHLVVSICLLSLMGYGIARASTLQQETTPPEPNQDNVTTNEDTPVLIDVLANDLPEGDSSLVIVAVGEPLSGTAQITDGQILYTPDKDFSGDDTFFYSIHNGDTANTRQATVRVTVEEVDDGPLDIFLDNDTIAENAVVGAVVGNLDAEFEKPNKRLFALLGLRFSLVGDDNDNDKFSIIGKVLSLNGELDFETQETYLIDVHARNLRGQTVVKRFAIKVTDTNDPPSDITLSNDLIDENQPAGAIVGTLSSVDVDAGDSHTYTLVDGVGSEDGGKFRIEGDILKTDTLLDFENKPIYSVRIASTDSSGQTFEKIFFINLNNIPSPPDAVPEPLTSCTGDPITLVDQGVGASAVVLEVEDVVISNKTEGGCEVEGTLNITSNGSTVNGLAFSGRVNARDQFSEASIPDFTINVAGLPLVARNVELIYNSERPALHITRPELKMPKEFGGLSSLITVPTFIDVGGIRIGDGKIDLPTIVTDSGFEMSLTGELKKRGDGFQIDADGSLTIPNIGKKKNSDSEGQECEISAGVTIFVDAQNRTVMSIKAGDELLSQQTLAPTAAFSPEAVDGFQLEKVRAGVSCSPGLPIGQTGLFLTGLSGEITVIPGEERLDVVVNIEAGKSIPGIGPILALEGSMGLQPRPFELDLGVALQVLSIEVARAEANITTTSFRTSISFQSLFFNGSAEINAFTRNGRATFTGSARVSIEIKKGSINGGGKCRFIRIRLCPPPLPPFSSGKLATVGADVGEFTNGSFGFKGFVKFFGTHGFFVDHRGRLTFRDINRFQLIASPDVQAAQEAWLNAADNGDILGRASIDSQYQFLENVDGIEGNDGVIINAPLTKPAVSASQFDIRGATDVISQVNLIQHGDVIFNMFADAPLEFTLITPQGQEVTPANYDQSGTLGYDIEYLQMTQYELVGAPEGEFEEEVGPKLLFTPLSAEEAVNGVDLRIDGIVVYFDLDFQNSHEWLDAFPLAPGDHLIELVENGTNNVVRSTTVNLADEGQISLINVGGSAPGMVTISDDTSAPSEFGKTKVRFFNGTDNTLDLVVDGSPLLLDVAYKAVSDYVEIDAGTKTITVRYSSTDVVVGELTAAELPEGGVYTFMSTDFSSNGLDVTIIQREDALYELTYLTYYNVDQAQMNELWQMKVVGDTDNNVYVLSVMGPDSPPILGSVTVDASNPAATQVNWQLTSDNNPTLISVYANPGEISVSLPLTLENGTVDVQEIPLYEGILIAEFEISDLAGLGGQLVTKQLDLSTLPSGTYHLWVRADDGVNPPIETYAELPVVSRSGEQSVYGTNAVWIAKDDFEPMARIASAAEIVIDHSDDFPTEWAATVDTSFDPETRSLYIEWLAQNHPDTDLYLLYFGHEPLNPTQVITVGGSIQEFDENGLATGVEVGFTTLEDIQPGVNYFISIEGVDIETGRSVRSPEFTFIVDSGTFALSSSQATVKIAAGGKGQVPVTLNASNDLFFPNVWLSANLGGAAPGITARFVDDVDGLTSINPANPTHQLEITVDSSVPHGTYPIEIAGYNGDAEENLTIHVVVGETGGPIANLYLPFVSR